MGKVLVFGANGFVGSYLAREFANHGYGIVASDIADAPRNSLVCDSYASCNLLDAEAVARIVYEAQPDVLVNLAAISSVGLSWGMPQKTIEVNVVGTLNVLEAARAVETSPKVLLVGSSEEYAPSSEPLDELSPLAAGNPYGISKESQERFASVYAQRFGLRVYRVRAFNHTGVGQAESFVLPSFCKQAAQIELSGRSGEIRVGNLSVKRDFSDVRDVVRAYRLLVESDHYDEVFNIGSGTAYSLEELLQSIIGNCSQKVEVMVDPERLRPSDNPIICCNRAKAAQVLGWEPEHEIQDTLREMFASFISTEQEKA